MSAKTASILLGIGSLMLVCGVLLIAAASGNNGEESALLGGASMFSTGAVMVGLGFYLKARALNPKVMQLSEAPPRTPKRAQCEVCQGSPAIITCAPHRANLCVDCMVGHYDARSCSYAPFARRSARAAVTR